MISSFSDTGYLILRLPHPRSCFFEKSVLQHLLGQRFLQITRPGAKRLDLVRSRLARRVAGQTLPAGFQNSFDQL